MTRPNLNQPIDCLPTIVATQPSQIINPSVLDAQPELKGVFVQPDAEVYLGGPEVNSATGIKLNPDQILYLDWSEGFQWYACTPAGTANLRVLPIG